MNKAILMGRLTRDPDIRYTQGENSLCIARFTLAVDRRRGRNANGQDNQQTADFINCVAFGRQAEHAEKYYHKGIKIAISGRIQTGSYTNKDGVKVYTTEVVVEEQEFAESRAASQGYGGQSYGGGQQSYGGYDNGGYSQNRSSGRSGAPAPAPAPAAPAQGGADPMDGFMNIPDGIDEELPFA